MLTIKRK